MALLTFDGAAGGRARFCVGERGGADRARWKRLQKSGMRGKYSWRERAKEYEAVYRKIASAGQSGPSGCAQGRAPRSPRWLLSCSWYPLRLRASRLRYRRLRRLQTLPGSATSSTTTPPFFTVGCALRSEIQRLPILRFAA